MRRKPHNALVEHALDLMADWASVSARAMFGGWGLYRDNQMFALVINDTLYLKTDAQSAPCFAATGSAPFVYEGKGRDVTTSYWQAPEECLESLSAMRQWCALAWEAAVRSRRMKPQRRRSARTKS